jgi:hypothetical protein
VHRAAKMGMPPDYTAVRGSVATTGPTGPIGIVSHRFGSCSGHPHKSDATLDRRCHSRVLTVRFFKLRASFALLPVR